MFQIIKKIYIIIILLIIPSIALSESVFLKDGSIIEGKIIKEAKEEITIRTIENKIEKVKTKKVLRTLYSNEYKKLVNIIKLNGKSIKAHIVYEDKDSYILRKNLEKKKKLKF